ncbi:MAG TPA: response regulator [Terriglobia bacterium]|nr:response regulator [Terriglobia bacterium]
MSSRILIVEDEPSIVMPVQVELQFEGFEVHTASDGPSALAAARDIRPDVFLLDLMLTGMNGFDDLWIIILTVGGQEADRSRDSGLDG